MKAGMNELLSRPGWGGVGFLTAYLVGAVPYGFLLGRLKGIDIRQCGSGNIGATNVWRVLGKGWGMVTFALDFAKVPVALFLVKHGMPVPSDKGGPGASAEPMILILVFLGAVLGHNYPLWLRFKGGKGIATSAGGLLWLAPGALGVALGVWIVVFAISRYVSLASMIAAGALPVGFWIFKRDDPLLLAFMAVLGALAIWRHRANIQRLLQGTEHRWTRNQREADMRNGGAT